MTDSTPHSSWEIALMDLKNCAANGHAGEVTYLRSIEIAGGLVRDYVNRLEEQFETQQAQIVALLRVVGDYEQRLGVPEFMRWQMPYGTGGNLSESYPASRPD